MFWEEKEETSSVWEETGSRGRKVKARKVDGGEEVENANKLKSK